MWDDFGEADNDFALELEIQAIDFTDNRERHKTMLSGIPNNILLLKYLAEARYSEELNNIVENGRFRAFDIAVSLYESKKPLTFKQANALRNVLAYFYAQHGV